MEIKFKDDIQYHVDYNNYLTKDSKLLKIRRKIFIWFPITVMAFLIITTVYPWDNSSLLTTLLLLLLGLTWLLVSPKLNNLLANISRRLSIKIVFDLKKHNNSTITIMLNENEIIKKSASIELKALWSNIDNLVVTDKYIYIHHKTGYIQIPLVTFKSLEDRADFLNCINGNITK